MKDLAELGKVKVVVVGAGLAGLTAAWRLYQKGYDVAVYEARPRVGGRVHTAMLRNLAGEYSVAELGGQNIADGGAAKNLLALAAELKLDVAERYFKLGSLFYHPDFFTPTQELLNNFALSPTALTKKLIQLSETCHSIQEILDHLFPTETPLKRFCMIRITAYEGYLPRSLSTYHNLDTLKYILLGGISEAHQPSSKGLLMQTIQQGNAMLPLKIAELLGERVHLNKVLRTVDRQESKIALQFQDESIVMCDKLILAIPVPIYQQLNFAPTILTASRLNLIKNIQCGENAKIMLPVQAHIDTFNQVVTETMVSFFNSDQQVLNMYFINDDGSMRLKESVFRQQRAILQQANIAATFNSQMPQEPLDLPMQNYECPVIKSWVQDPYAKGSYSFYNSLLGAQQAHTVPYRHIRVNEIFAPVNDQVFFIGEHTTILPEIGTLEAAVESGERIASVFN